MDFSVVADKLLLVDCKVHGLTELRLMKIPTGETLWRKIIYGGIPSVLVRSDHTVIYASNFTHDEDEKVFFKFFKLSMLGRNCVHTHNKGNDIWHDIGRQ
jgi:hypothetical protein